MMDGGSRVLGVIMSRMSLGPGGRKQHGRGAKDGRDQHAGQEPRWKHGGL
jgi:hypothetical protein